MAGSGVLSGLDRRLPFLTVSTVSQLPLHGGAVDGGINLGDESVIEIFFFCHGADFLQDSVPAAGLQDGQAAALLYAADGLGDTHPLRQQVDEGGIYPVNAGAQVVYGSCRFCIGGGAAAHPETAEHPFQGLRGNLLCGIAQGPVRVGMHLHHQSVEAQGNGLP